MSIVGYKHRWGSGESAPWPAGKVVCVGRNYVEHAKELNNPLPKQPLLFLKPATSLVDMLQPIHYPKQFGDCHFETEIALLIGETLGRSSEVKPDLIKNYVAGVGLALDLTLRDLQSELKKEGQPWEKAKAFDGACPISPFVPINEIDSLPSLSLKLSVDGEVRQQGGASEMITGFAELLVYMSQFFTLLPGDVVLTGTPKGVGPLISGNQFELSLLEGNKPLWEGKTVIG